MSAIGRTELKQTTMTDKDGVPIRKKDEDGKHTDEPRKVTDGGISAIVQNMEKLISFSWGLFQFVDSYAFLSSSLDRLVGNTPKENLRITKRDYPTWFSMARERQQERFDLVTRKRIYPYEYMDSFDRSDEEQLPPQSKFYSSLSDESITDEDYKHAQRVWRAFNSKIEKENHT